MNKARLTISDIAKEAGVSIGAVSSVLNNKKDSSIRVGEEKRKKILRIIDKSSYVPCKSARALVTQRTNTLGIIVHKLTPFFSEFITLIQQEAFRNHLEIMPYITNNDPLMEESYLRQCADGRVDGIITVAHTKGSPERYRKFSLPPYSLRIVSYGPETKGIPTFDFDYQEAGRIACMHLKETGCSRIGCFGGGETNPRMQSFLAAASSHGYHPAFFTAGKDKDISSFSESREVAAKFFNSTKCLPDGVFCFNDIMAVSFIVEAQVRGLNIPEDIAVIGCDNSEICIMSNPALTSIDSNVSLLAETALKKIIQAIKGIEGKPIHTTITPRLVVRGSTSKKQGGAR